ncbi:three-helix bundle dimerization domain-containing protein [Nocardia aurantiaca]|uniref:DUF3562 domain-containing protein n=1 Tax=Nocardia aurantiaca TaxID=2675850 RepID=A0A6I3L031_9NOCA|nr:hypothetical protein [Nocardia aurantiaca]MTE15642.1 hypothetical protein [Nocardia aurantiaca]
MRDDEDTQIQFALERLIRRHPEVPPSRVAGVVAQAREVFVDAKVRNFVPLLIERRAALELAAMSGVQSVPAHP